jgi:hypothetical protein
MIINKVNTIEELVMLVYLARKLINLISVLHLCVIQFILQHLMKLLFIEILKAIIKFMLVINYLGPFTLIALQVKMV